eukprot:TRINITY_DN49546_c0_g1_i1.p1 TRINITY_DN49546_c0_g1~~TRINITY_DN49546_c0_g1_i1.p1  ORF type:complete len:604 (-),score=90.77 TRINITY_DN49546_c0_g1_i1:182-1993(-)
MKKSAAFMAAAAGAGATPVRRLVLAAATTGTTVLIVAREDPSVKPPLSASRPPLPPVLPLDVVGAGEGHISLSDEGASTAVLPAGSILSGCDTQALTMWLYHIARQRHAVLVPSVWTNSARVGFAPDWENKMTDTLADRAVCVERYGGRFWMVDTVFKSNFTDAEGGTITSPGDPLYVPRSLCAPKECSRATVRARLLPVAWLLTVTSAKLLQSEARSQERISLLLMPPTYIRRMFRLASKAVRSFGEVYMEPLGSWEELELDWAVLGYEGCGTTSLARSLHAHPRLELLYVEGNRYFESNFFWADWPDQARFSEPNVQNLKGRLLPRQLEVNLFNRWATKVPLPRSSLAATGAATAESLRQQRRLRGIKSPKYIHDPASLKRLSLIAGLRVLLLVDDPVVRIERGYLKNVGAWIGEGSSHRNETLAMLPWPRPPPPPLEACLGQPCGPLIYDAPGFFEKGIKREFNIVRSSFAVASQIRDISIRFGVKNVFLATRTDLARGGRAFLDRVAAFLGVQAFPVGAQIESAGNAGHHARKPTSVLREDVLEAIGTDAREAHARTLASLRAYFTAERVALRSLFSELPPHRHNREELPVWLAEDTSA